jgi:hypothetical protein
MDQGTKSSFEISQQYVESERDYEHVKEINKVHGRVDQINTWNECRSFGCFETI